MADKKLKDYAITLIVKPKQQGAIRYGSKTFKGITFANTPGEAKDVATRHLISCFDPTFISSEMVTVKECTLYNDFITKA